MELTIAIILGLIVWWHIMVACSLIGTRWGLLIPYNELPEPLRGPHGDWLLARRIPRFATAFLSPKDPIKLLGSAPKGVHYDIVPLGTWVLTWPLFFAFRTKAGWMTRFGARRDYTALEPNNRYYQWPSFTPFKRQL